MALCCCCTYEEDNFIRCSNGHPLCYDCIPNGVSNAIGTHKYLKCPDTSRCEVIIDESQISEIINPNLLRAYSNNVINLSIENLENLHRCLNCDYAATIEGVTDIFNCPTCDKNYCITCKRDLHPNRPCNPEIYSEEDALTESFIIRCVCGIGLVKADACNHITCRCGARYCWYCKQPGWHDGRCHLYNEPPLNIPDANVTSARIAERLRQADPAERARQERVERENRAQAVLVRIEEQRLEEERLERLRIQEERRRDEEERLERLRLEQQRIEDERRRIEEERLERERLELQRLEEERLERIRLEMERLESKRQEDLTAMRRMIQALEKDRQPIPQSEYYNNKSRETFNSDGLKFFEACGRGRFRIVDRMLNETNVERKYGLCEAVEKNHVEIVRRILQDGKVQANFLNNKTLRRAIEYGHVEAVKLLLTNQDIATSIDYDKYARMAQKFNQELITLYLLELKFTSMVIQVE